MIAGELVTGYQNTSYNLLTYESASGLLPVPTVQHSIFQQMIMKLLNEHLKAVKEKFPEEGARIEALYASDEDFRTLCEDYFSCIQHLQKFKKEFSEKQYSFDEYQSIRADLEKELYNFILPEND